MTVIEQRREHKRTTEVVHCAAMPPQEFPCRYRAVMTWFGIPFCVAHAPVRKPGSPGWNRL